MRSYLAQTARRDARMYLAPKGVLDAEAIDNLRSGEDGSIIEIDEQYAGNLANVIVPIQHGPVSSNIYNSMNLAEGDFDRSTTISPAALGQVTKATASEVMAIEGHTQSEFGRHAEQRDLFLIQIVKRCLAAYVASLYDVGDSEGAEQDLDEEGRELSDDQLEQRREEEGLEDDDNNADDNNTNDDSYSGREDEIEEIKEDEDLDEEDSSILNLASRIEPEREAREKERHIQKLVLIDYNNELIEVSPEDLDSDFDIGFSEAGRSPVAQAEMRSNVLQLSDKMLQLLQVAQEAEGSMSVLAIEMYKTIHEQFEFPNNLSFEYVQGQVAEQASEEAPVEPGPEAPPEAPPEEGAPPEQMSAEEVVAQIETLPVDQQIVALEQAFADEPKILQLLEKAKGLPPEEQQEAVRVILDAIKGSE